jgi:hypothetical protein
MVLGQSKPSPNRGSRYRICLGIFSEAAKEMWFKAASLARRSRQPEKTGSKIKIHVREPAKHKGRTKALDRLLPGIGEEDIHQLCPTSHSVREAGFGLPPTGWHRAKLWMRRRRSVLAALAGNSGLRGLRKNE